MFLKYNINQNFLTYSDLLVLNIQTHLAEASATSKIGSNKT